MPACSPPPPLACKDHHLATWHYKGVDLRAVNHSKLPLQPFHVPLKAASEAVAGSLHTSGGGQRAGWAACLPVCVCVRGVCERKGTRGTEHRQELMSVEQGGACLLLQQGTPQFSSQVLSRELRGHSAHVPRLLLLLTPRTAGVDLDAASSQTCSVLFRQRCSLSRAPAQAMQDRSAPVLSACPRVAPTALHGGLEGAVCRCAAPLPGPAGTFAAPFQPQTAG